MTQEDKELLLKDLCARLPYKLICEVEYKEGGRYKTSNMFLSGVFTDEAYFTSKKGSIYSNGYKPYLFPMSSMTEEQKKEYDSIIYHNIELHCERYYNVIDVDSFEELQEFYHKNHLDYRNLIGFGLALDATGQNVY